MASFDFGSGFGDLDLSTFTNGADMSVPLGDVSNGAQNMQPYSSSGEWYQFSDQTQSAIWGGLDKVLNYALAKDAAKMQQPQLQQQQQYAQVQQSQQNGNSRILLWAALGAGVFLLINR